MLKIHNLTREQVQMLNKLWTMNTLEEVLEFRDTLPLFRRQQIDTLLEMVRLQIIDDDVDANPEDLIVAQELLVPFIEKNR